MSRPNLNSLRLSNEQMLLVNILNTMYNDNLRHINLITETLHTLTESNNQIRNTLLTILGTNNIPSSAMRTSASVPTTTTVPTTTNIPATVSFNNNPTLNASSRRVLLNNIPYIIDDITGYNVSQNGVEQLNVTNNVEELLTIIREAFIPNTLRENLLPTQQQINAATRQILYGDIVRPINTTCPISMEDFREDDNVLMIRHCGHIFRQEDLTRWFQTNFFCPVCRYDIREDSVVTRDISNNEVENNRTTDLSGNRVDDILTMFFYNPFTRPRRQT
jgi:hypothetical protein